MVLKKKQQLWILKSQELFLKHFLIYKNKYIYDIKLMMYYTNLISPIFRKIEVADS